MTRRTNTIFHLNHTVKTISYQKLGDQSFSTGHYLQALKYYQRALAVSGDDPGQLADLFGSLGNVYGAIGQIEEAVRYYEKAVKIHRREEDFSRLGTTFVNIGNLYSDRGEIQAALTHYKKGLLLLEQERKWDALSTLYGNLSLLSLKQFDTRAALDYADRALQTAKRLNHPNRMADALHRLAKAKDENGETVEAQRLSESAYDLYARLKDEMGCAMTLYHQAALYEKRADLMGAIDCLTQVVAIDKKYKLPKLSENKERLSRLRSRMKRPRTP